MDFDALRRKNGGLQSDRPHSLKALKAYLIR